MKKFLLHALLYGITLATLSACNSSSSSSNTTNNPDQSSQVQPFETDTLDLDFTLPLGETGMNIGELSGVTAVLEEGLLVILDDNQSLLFLNASTGEYVDQQSVIVDDNTRFAGVTRDSNGYFLITDNAQIYHYDPDSGELEKTNDFSSYLNDSSAIAYDADSSTLFAINATGDKTLVSLSDGVEATKQLATSFGAYTITGMYAADNSVFLLSTGFEEESSAPASTPVLIQITAAGEFVKAWELNDMSSPEPTGLVVTDSEAPKIFTVNAGSEKAIKTYEPVREGSEVDEPALALIEQRPLDFDQPSGVDASPDGQTLYFVTDFGEVRQMIGDSEATLLFEIEAQQGSYEAIAVNGTTLTTLASDESLENPELYTFNLDGSEIQKREIPLSSPNHNFEAIDYIPNTDTFYTVTSNEGEPKVLYTVDGQSGQTTTREMPQAYNELIISGIDVSSDEQRMVFTTEEREIEDELFTGLAIIVDLNTFEELGRYSIAVTNEEDKLVGLSDPSGVAFDEANGVFYITSDIDDSVLYIYELPAN